MTKTNPILVLALATLPVTFAAAQSAMTIEGINAEVRLFVDQSNCPGPNCFDPVTETADNLDDLPLSIVGTANNVDGIPFTGRADAMASFDKDGLRVELEAYAPGDECCGGNYLFFDAISTVTIGLTLSEDSLIRIDANYFSYRGSANGTNRFTITNLATEEVIHSNSWGVSEQVWPAGNYILEAESIGDISCECSSTMSQIIRIEDRPIPDLAALSGLFPSVYLQLNGSDTYTGETVEETNQADTLDDLPLIIFEYFEENPKDGWENWIGRTSSSAVISPNRFTTFSSTSADSMGWATNHRHWNAVAYFDFTFDLELASSVDIEYVMTQTESTTWGQAEGETYGRFRLKNIDTDEVVMDIISETIGVESDAFSIVLEPGQYVVWCDASANGNATAGSSNHQSATKIDMLFNPWNPADFNRDGQINGADLGTLISKWGPCSGCPEDLNGDDIVNGADLGLFIASWTG